MWKKITHVGDDSHNEKHIQEFERDFPKELAPEDITSAASQIPTSVSDPRHLDSSIPGHKVQSYGDEGALCTCGKVISPTIPEEGGLPRQWERHLDTERYNNSRSNN